MPSYNFQDALLDDEKLTYQYSNDTDTGNDNLPAGVAINTSTIHGKYFLAFFQQHLFANFLAIS